MQPHLADRTGACLTGGLWSRILRQCCPSRMRAGDAPEYSAGGQPCSTRIVEVEQSSDQFARGVEAGNRAAIDTLRARIAVDAQTAEGKRYPASHGVGLEWRRIDGIGPIGLVHCQAFRAPAVAHGGIELDILTHRCVVRRNFAEHRASIDIVDL